MLELSDELRLIFVIHQEDARCRHIQILILPRAALNSVSHTHHQTVVTILRNIPLRTCWVKRAPWRGELASVFWQRPKKYGTLTPKTFFQNVGLNGRRTYDVLLIG